jgi:CRP/FNR family transcriptional regulator, cyclic AMP receptor protein
VRWIFSQGDFAQYIFHLRKGRIKLTVLSALGKEAIVAILGAGSFFGECGIMGQTKCTTAATALTDVSLLRIPGDAFLSELQHNAVFSTEFVGYLMSRISRLQEDLADQLLNSSEKRLARILLLLANFGERQGLESAVLRISQETLAEMIGTTRPRVSFFLNKFRKLGLVEYNGGLKIHNSLADFVARH